MSEAPDQHAPPELINPDEVTVKFVIDEECEPCQQILKHLEEYGGKYEIIDPLSAESERFWDEKKVEFPAAVIQREDGEEIPCEIFMDDQNLVVLCEGKLMVIREPSPELLEDLQEQPKSPCELPQAP